MTITLPAVGPDLPIHPRARHPRTGAPIQAIGWLRGRPVWPIMGASPDDPLAGDGDGDGGSGDGDGDGDGSGDGDGDGADGDGALGDAGKKALDAMKGQRNKARSDLRPWNALARELGVKTPDELRALLAKKNGSTGGDGDGQPDAEQIRREARAEVERETLRDRVLDKIEAKARGFADPVDAAALLLRQREVDDFVDGSRIDGDAIAEALAELLESKPYLAAQGGNGGGRKGPKPDPGQGPRPKDKATSLDSGRSLYQERHKKKTTTST